MIGMWRRGGEADMRVALPALFHEHAEITKKSSALFGLENVKSYLLIDFLRESGLFDKSGNVALKILIIIAVSAIKKIKHGKKEKCG